MTAQCLELRWVGSALGVLEQQDGEEAAEHLAAHEAARCRLIQKLQPAHEQRPPSVQFTGGSTEGSTADSSTEGSAGGSTADNSTGCRAGGSTEGSGGGSTADSSTAPSPESTTKPVLLPAEYVDSTACTAR